MSFMGQCICFTAFMMEQKKRTLFRLCWMRILTGLLPKSNPATERMDDNMEDGAVEKKTAQSADGRVLSALKIL